MSTYTVSTVFGDKDSLPANDPAKIIKGSEFTTEFNNLVTAVNSKSNSLSPTFTGTVTAAGSLVSPTITASGTVTGATVAATANVTAPTVTATNIVATSKVTANTSVEVTGTVPKLELYEGDTTNLNTSVRNNSGKFQILKLSDAGVGSDIQMTIDHSNGFVGINNNSPEAQLDIVGDLKTSNLLDVRNRIQISAQTPRIIFFEEDTTDVNTQIRTSTGKLQFQKLTDNGATATVQMVLDHATGNFGINDAAPSNKLSVGGNITATGNIGGVNLVATGTAIAASSLVADAVVAKTTTPTLKLSLTDTSIVDSDVLSTVLFSGLDDSATDYTGASLSAIAASDWSTGISPADLVFKTTGVASGAALEETLRIGADNIISLSRPTNGAIARYKVGSNICGVTRISFASGEPSMLMGSDTTGLGFIQAGAGGFDNISPYNPTNGSVLNGVISLGRVGAQWDDIYSVNAVTVSSDQNLKQDIEALDEAETRVAIACKGLIRKYKWRSAVEKKGDEARYHFGVIAQDLQAAFAAEGLDAGDYGVFVSSTWTDDNGVEQTRLGVRYTELLAFIIGGL